MSTAARRLQRELAEAEERGAEVEDPTDGPPPDAGGTGF